MARAQRSIGTHHTMRRLRYLIQGVISSTLLVVLLFAPLAPLFADEIPQSEPEDSATDQEETASETENTSNDPEQEASPVSVEEQEELATTASVFEEESLLVEAVSADATEVSLNNETNDGTVADGAEETTKAVDSEEGIPVDEETEPVDPGNTEPEDDAVSDESSDDISSENTEDEDGILEVEITPEGTVEEVAPEENVVVANTVTNDANRYSFSKSECTVVGDGSFYCAKSESAAVVTNNDRIFVATDADGDKEIFVEHDGEISAFTQNTADDDAPYYDEVSDSVVWHRLINGRYQIIAYSFDTEEEVQLTQGPNNSMEPTRYGDSIVWQAWVENGWEIMFSDDGEIQQLTENEVPDIAPSINKNYIVWQSQENGVWQANVYDRASGDIEVIENAEGLGVENARFVLVYDTKHENGDIETRGYDLKTKRTIPLGALPAAIPEHIPEPDQTGEERALVQSLTQIKPKTGGEEDALPGEEPLDIDDTGEEPASISDLIIPDTETDSPSASTTPTYNATSTSHIPELIIEPVEAAQNPTPEGISDVVIPPFVPAASDSQEDVASGL